MNAPDEIIHQSLRLRIMAALNPLRESQPLEFTRLKAIVQATDGNLGSHLGTLEQAGYLQIIKDFAGKKPRTRVVMTPKGRRAFAAHVGYLRDVLGEARLRSAESED